MKNLNVCPIKEFDDIFYATKMNQGFNNALLAIKYVLFNDKSMFKNSQPVDNKYLYISKNNNARKKAMLLQQDDLAHILIKYCLSSFGLRGKPFTINDQDFINFRKNITKLEITAYEMIELISYAAIGDVYLAYNLLFDNNKLLNELVEYMIQERYLSNLHEMLDNFNGIIVNDKINKEERFKFYEAYVNIDNTFAEIKRNNKEYIK